MSLVFHAAPPDGSWANDPNGIGWAAGAYRLFVQHRTGALDPRATGWARYSSSDLLRWTFDGAVIGARDEAWSYSGSVTFDPHRIEALHTVHDPVDCMQHQVRRISHDAGKSWELAPLNVGDTAPARNRRDPFAFVHGAGRWMLLAAPCDWYSWRDEPGSRLLLFRSTDGIDWRAAGDIGPWHPPGVLWEVPVVVDIAGRTLLLISLVDRRGDGADCSVRAWAGAFEGAQFVLSRDWPTEGQLVDLGPDFYALMAGSEAISGRPVPLFVAWLSSWSTAQRMPWPGFAGGPVSLPRCLTIEPGEDGPRLRSRPAPSIVEAFAIPCDAVPRAGMGEAWFDGVAAFELVLTSAEGSVVVAADPQTGQLSVDRRGAEWLTWSRAYSGGVAPGTVRGMQLFVDGPCIELFLLPEGPSISIALPGDGRPFTVELTVAGVAGVLAWRMLADVVDPPSRIEAGR